MLGKVVGDINIGQFVEPPLMLSLWAILMMLLRWCHFGDDVDTTCHQQQKLAKM